MSVADSDVQEAGTPTSDSVRAATGDSTGSGRRQRTIVGKVHSDKMQKTRTVRVQRLVKHPKYGKYIRRRSTFYVHDENEASHEGDTVLIAATRPLSKLKRWRLVRVLTRAAGSEPLEQQGASTKGTDEVRETGGAS